MKNTDTPVSRRKFIELSLKGAVIIGVSNTLQSFAGDSFRLPPKDAVNLRFVIASDGHYGQPDTKYEAMHDEMISWLNIEKQERGIDFAMINGDLFHDAIEFLPVVKKKWDALSMPYYVSHGNHDKATEAVWQQTFNSKWHHTYMQQGAAFMVLNTSDETGKYICPDLVWTKEQMDKLSNAQSLFVFMHITPFDLKKNDAVIYPALVEMFDKQPNLKAVFHGHDHDMDNVKQHNDKFYFFDSHIAGNWGTDYRGYRIVELLKTGEILTYQINPGINKQVNNNRLQ